jgi:superfamily II DNA/RNA helicase
VCCLAGAHYPDAAFSILLTPNTSQGVDLSAYSSFPSVVQARTIPALLTGRDVLGAAQHFR